MTIRRYDRPRRPRIVASDGISVAAPIWWRLSDTDPPADAGSEELFKYRFVDEDVLAEAWRAHGAMILARWIQDRPGSRPSCWFAFDAPRMPAGRFPGAYYDGKFPELRLRLGGRGTPEHEVLRVVPRFECGLPASWVADWWIDRWRANGEPHRAQRFEPADPPKYESQASYLRRLGLFARGEERRARREQFAPEVLPEHLWPLTDEELRDA